MKSSVNRSSGDERCLMKPSIASKMKQSFPVLRRWLWEGQVTLALQLRNWGTSVPFF